MKKILIFTQKINKNDPVLGFFHRWLLEFSKHFEYITVVCLEVGEYDLPKNIKVLSLGKESGISKIKYIFNFYKYILSEIGNYDSVFVHMNEEYVLLGGLVWGLFGKKVSMWRNHHAGSWKTRLAGILSDKVFCTSRYSFTASFKNTKIMPVGIDTDFFKKDNNITKIPHSILFLARISPVKKPHVLIEALGILKKDGVPFVCSIYGNPLPKDFAYYQSLKDRVRELDLEAHIVFKEGVANDDTVKIYNEHEVFINLSSSGMYDKTIFEAMACGSVVIATNKNLIGVISDDYLVTEDDIIGLVSKLRHIFYLTLGEKDSAGVYLRDLVLREHSLSMLAKILSKELN